MNIAIVGAGSASTAFLLSAFKFIQQHNIDVNITCIHDPKIPIMPVGESASSPILDLLKSVIDFYPLTDLSKLDGTIRWGVRYFWKTANKDFDVPYPNPAFHFNSAKLSPFVIDKIKEKYKNFNEIHDTIVDILDNGKIIGLDNTYIFDWVIDARGTPLTEILEDTSIYSKPTFQAVNSAIIFPEFKEYNEMFTSAHIHNNGWMFGIPLSHRKAWGYLYNNTITSFDEAVADFKNLKGLTDTEIEKCNKISWTQYYKNTALTGKVLSIGNRLYFFEPAQALPLHYYVMISEIFLQLLLENNPYAINDHHLNIIKDIESLIAMNYIGKNSIDSKFWKTIHPVAMNFLKTHRPWQHWVEHNQDYDYSFHTSPLMHFYINGLDIDLAEFIKK
jgi:hypothetical protein